MHQPCDSDALLDFYAADGASPLESYLPVDSAANHAAEWPDAERIYIGLQAAQLAVFISMMHVMNCPVAKALFEKHVIEASGHRTDN